MSHDPLDPTTDPLLSKLGQLGVPAGLLTKAAVAAPVVFGLAGARLYCVIATAVATGLGGGVVITVLAGGGTPRPTGALALIEQAQGIEEGEQLIAENEVPVPEPEVIVERVVETVYVHVPQPATPAPVCPEPPALDASAHDDLAPSSEPRVETDDEGDWIPDPVYEERSHTPREIEPDARADASASAEVVPRARPNMAPIQPAEGHLRIGADSGAIVFPEVGLGNLSVAFGLELLGPGAVRAAPLLAVDFDAGLMGNQRLGMLTVDGEAGLAVRPKPDVRIQISGLGGIRLLEGLGWGAYIDRPSATDEESRSSPGTYDALDRTRIQAFPIFGGRFGLVIGDPLKSPLAFRASISGQGMVYRDSSGTTPTTVLPRVGGTVGLDILLPRP